MVRLVALSAEKLVMTFCDGTVSNPPGLVKYMKLNGLAGPVMDVHQISEPTCPPLGGSMNMMAFSVALTAQTLPCWPR